MEKNRELLEGLNDIFGLKHFNIRKFDDDVVVDSLSNNISFIFKNLDIKSLGFWHQCVDVAKSDKIDEKYVRDYYVLPYPFEKFKVSDILTLTDNVRINDFEDDSKKFSSDEWKVLKDFLSYNFYLDIKIHEYLKNSYRMQSVGFDMPKASDYINVLIEKVSGYIIASLRLHIVPSVDELMTRFGLYSSDDMCYLGKIIDFYIYNMGLKRVSPTSGELVNASDEERVDVTSIVKTIYEKNLEKLLSKRKVEGELRRNI